MTSGGNRTGAGRPKKLKQITVRVSPDIMDMDMDAVFESIGPIVIDKIKRISTKEPGSMSENEYRILPSYLKLLEFFKSKAPVRNENVNVEVATIDLGSEIERVRKLYADKHGAPQLAPTNV